MLTTSSQKLRITKQFTFDMAHALYGHNGACKNIHGHTYTLSVTLLGQVINQFGNTSDGMVADFSLLKAIVQQEIISVYDHALVLNAAAPYEGRETFGSNFGKIIYLHLQPTCENLVLIIVEKLQKSLPKELHLHSVCLQETPTASAEWHYSDNR